MRALLALPLVIAACGPMPMDWERYAIDASDRGLLRQDRAPEDAPYTKEDLIAAFDKIAFSFESDPFETGDAATTGEEIIRKVLKGPHVLVYNPDSRERAALVNRMRRYSARLAEATGLSPQIFTDPEAFRRVKNGHSQILVLQANEPELARLADPESTNNPFADLDRETDWFTGAIGNWRTSRSPCGGRVVASSGGDRPEGEILFVFLMFRSGLPEIMLESCIEEELAQSLGLFDDDPGLRPSVFNDDGEFALLTEHDADLLRLLYHPRIKPGMTRPDAMAIIRELVEKDAIGPSS